MTWLHLAGLSHCNNVIFILIVDWIQGLSSNLNDLFVWSLDLIFYVISFLDQSRQILGRNLASSDNCHHGKCFKHRVIWDKRKICIIWSLQTRFIVFRKLQSFYESCFKKVIGAHGVAARLQLKLWSSISWINYTCHYFLFQWLALRFPKAAIYLDSVRECYEALVILSFLAYLLSYLYAEYEDFDHIMEAKHEVHHLFPVCCLPDWKMGRFVLYLST